MVKKKKEVKWLVLGPDVTTHAEVCMGKCIVDL